MKSGAEFYDLMRGRRSVRLFSERGVDRGVIEDCVRAAGSGPSGANMQPWHFVIVSDAAVKGRIRAACEEVERSFYAERAGEEFLGALGPLGTDASKPFLERAPYLIVVFEQRYGLTAEGEKVRHYYVKESVGIAVGFLIAAVHHAGLACLCYTPSPMGFLNEMLGRGENERAMMILVVGYPEEGAAAPEIGKKSLGEIATFI
jgi:nitroreductase